MFANEKEITTLYQVNSFEEAADAALQDCEMAVLTRSEAGSVIVAGGETIEIEAEPVRESGRHDRRRRPLCRGLPLWADPRRAAPGLRARSGSLAAAEAIGHIGARPEISLAQARQGNGAYSARAGVPVAFRSRKRQIAFWLYG